MPAPFLFIGLPLACAPLVYLLRRWRRVETLLTAGVAFLLTLLALSLPLDQPLFLLGGTIFRSLTTVLGRAFEIEPADRLALAFIFSQAAVLSVGAGLHGAGRYYQSAGLVIVGLIAAALFVRPFLFAALFLEIAAAVAVFMLGDETRPVTRGALRFLVFMTMGMPFILLSGWLIEGSAASPEDVSFIARATILLAVGFAVLLAVAPFHSWLPVVAEHSPPLAAAFVFTVMRFISVFLLLNFLGAYDWLGQNPAVYRALVVAGGGMALIGALFAFGQRNFGRSMGYALMVDIGAVLLAIGLNTPAGVEAALETLALRGVALPVWGMAVDQLRRVAGSDDFDAVRGLGRRYPFAATALVLSLLSLIGFPLTAGFPARWALLHLLAHIHPTGAILLLAGMVSIGVVCARGLNALLTPVADEEEREDAPLWSEKPTAVVLYSLGAGVILLLGVFPQLLLPLVAGTASVFAGAGP